MTVNDPTAPKVDRVFPSGLDAGGVVGGDEPLTFDASDNSGIQRADLVDVTPGSAQGVIGGNPIDCDYSFAKPCPNATGLTVNANSIQPGARTLQVRVTDAGGNVGESAPFTVQVGGSLNGSNASAAARLTATFTNRRSRATVGFGRRARVNGRVTDANGAPIAGAVIQVLDRQLRIGTGTCRGSRSRPAPMAASRSCPGRGAGAGDPVRVPVAPPARRAVRDRHVSMHVRAGVTLSIRPRRVGPNGRIRLSGRLRAGPIPRSGKVRRPAGVRRRQVAHFRDRPGAPERALSAAYRFTTPPAGGR